MGREHGNVARRRTAILVAVVVIGFGASFATGKLVKKHNLHRIALGSCASLA